MLLNHLDLERQQIEQQVNGEYGQSIDTFRDIVNQASQMADYFARGLMAREVSYILLPREEADINSVYERLT